MDITRGVRIKPNIVWREVENEAVILNVDNSNYYTLDTVGTAIWKLIAQQEKIQDIVRHIESEYDAGEGQVSKDLAALLEELSGEGLIELNG